MDVKMTWLTNLTTLFAKGSSPEAKFLGQPQILGQEPRPLEKSNLRLFFCFWLFFSILSSMSTVVSNNLLLG